MYKKGSKGWLKHFDFILLDMICLQIAFLLAYVIRHDSGSPYIVPLYRNMAIFMELLDIVVMFFYETLSNVLKRGYFREFAATVKHVLLVELFSVLYLFTMQEGQAYSRTALYLTGVIYAILTYIVRIIWKKILRSRMSEGNRSLLVVTTKDMAEQVVHNIRENNYERFALSGLVIIDDDLCGTKIAGVPVVANEENAAAYVCREWIDEVFVIPATDVPYPYALMEQFTEAGVTVHLNLAKVSEAMGGKKQLVEKVGPYTVLTTSINYASTKQLFMKRAIDIAGGLLGCLLTLLITLFVGPAIYLKSPGPIFFAQERVGKNGKKFKMYKFRSMYMDAEERKAELMKQNRVSDGMMFKLDFDPRVIGNEILPDGTKKTGIGNFIRVTSLDEFPQFFNVLKGDMSIVGTRPPTLDEWNKYELHHRARLAINTTISLLIPILTFNIADATLRYAIDQNSDKESVWRVSWHYYCISLLFMALFTGVNSFLGIFQEMKEYSLLMFLLYATTCLNGIVSNFCRGIDKIKDIAISGVVSSAVIILANIIFLLITKWGVIGYFLAYILGALSQVVYLSIAARIWRYMFIKPIDAKLSEDMTGFSKPMIVNSVAWWINSVSDGDINILLYFEY